MGRNHLENRYTVNIYLSRILKTGQFQVQISSAEFGGILLFKPVFRIILG